MQKNYKISLIGIFILLFLAGVCTMLYPYIRGGIVDQQLGMKAEEFLNRMEPSDQPEIYFTAPTEPEETRPNHALWEEMQSYNKTLHESDQVLLQNVSDYVQPSFVLTEYGMEDEIFGVISIPKLEVELPIYLGASDANMAAGAAHMSQTSIPIGGENTNAVIAAHRGWNGATYFLHIHKLVKGDTITITNLWETLTYQVADTNIISPTDVDAIRIQEGKDMITLMSCHPIASGGKQRYLVYCERVESP